MAVIETMLRKVLSLSALVATLHLGSSEPMIPGYGTYAPSILAERLDFTNTMPIDRTTERFDAPDDALSPLVDSLLAEARSHLGTGYRRGGKTPKGFDCSGFTGYVFRQFGYTLGASSREQFARDGVFVPDDEILPGDLLFFKGRSKGSVGHVGIAVSADRISGDITFIHSAISGGIRIDHTSAPYYRKRYLGARRVLQTLNH